MRRRKLISVFGAMALVVAMLPGCKSESEEPESSATMQENSQSVQESQEPESTETVRTPDYQNGGIAINAQNFPDEGFRRYISENMDDDRDGALSSYELTEFKNQTIKITEEYEVKDLTGIEFFPDLLQLEIARQDLKRLDVSHNKQLYRLECQLDQMTELILDNPALKQLDCMGNQLDQLDLSKVPNLSTLVCNNNKISTLDMKQVPNLQHLECSSNPLGSLDLSENLYLAGLICADAQLTSLNVSRNLLLSELLCNNNNLTELNVANNSMLYQLNCEHNQLTKLDVSNNTKLSSLSCNDNRLVTLDASKNRELWSLFCQNNALTELAVAGSSLSKIYCENNQLTDLDVSHCGSMVRVRADYDVEIEGKTMAPVGPSDILVDAAHFPDPAFLDFVYEEYDLDGNRALSEEEREAVEEMELYVNSYTIIMDGYTYQGGSYIGFGIHDLTGIEYFPYLQILNCKANQIERLDLTQNPALVYLECEDNALQTLDVSNNPNLGHVSCKDNALTCVDVSRCKPDIEVWADEGVEIIWPEGHVDVPVPESTEAESTPDLPLVINIWKKSIVRIIN